MGIGTTNGRRLSVFTIFASIDPIEAPRKLQEVVEPPTNATSLSESSSISADEDIPVEDSGSESDDADTASPTLNH